MLKNVGIRQKYFAQKENTSAEVSPLESEIDQMVHRLYGLTVEDSRIGEDGTMSEQAILRVDRCELLKGLKSWIKIDKSNIVDQTILSFDGRLMILDMVGMSFKVPAQGSWNGQARLSARLLISIAKVPPPGDPIIFRVDNGRLFIGNSSCACEWQCQKKDMIQLPLNVDTPSLLALKLRYTEEQINSSGLRAAVDDAEEKCIQDIKNAAIILEKYGVKKSAIRDLIRQALRESG